VSRIIAPALHSASLRTYVMVIVTTTVVVGGTVLVTDPDLGSVVPRTPILIHDVLIVAVIIAGALSAAFAQSTMSAVLSLGAVGYGVAMVFLSFGAPDLAMTQFSVETLTVLIYVLVFRHFHELGNLSPRSVRIRDGLIAAGVGLFIGGLLLSVATTETAPRLREFFAEFGPTLGHGRNIVNVILVDFRGFDTLAEITVLATAAIGVRGLLGLAANDRPRDELVSPVSSSIFRTAARLLMPLLLVFAVFLLLRGHNEPGGGFVGGLVAAAAFALYGIAFGVRRARQALLVDPLTLLGVGLLIALVSGLPAVFLGQPYLTALWPSGPVALGTPALFDVGVFLVVAGVVLMMIFSLAEESS
jgi:multicomponent Na+:H+ antiporter subunit A